MRVYIVTDCDLGWDNIIGVFTTELEAQKCVDNRSEPDSCVIHNKELEEKFEI
jgi:hypothetical protein